MNQSKINNGIPAEEHVLAGAVGAFLFSLVGGILWFVLYQVGFLAGVSGLVGVICALKGYSLFAKRESKKGVVIAVVMAVVVMIIAWYICMSYDMYNYCQKMYELGETEYTLTFFESVRAAYLFLTEPEPAAAYLTDLGIGLVLCAVGCGKNVIAAFRKVSEPPVQEPLPVNEAVFNTEAVADVPAAEESAVEEPVTAAPVAEETAEAPEETAETV